MPQVPRCLSWPSQDPSVELTVSNIATAIQYGIVQGNVMDRYACGTHRPHETPLDKSLPLLLTSPNPQFFDFNVLGLHSDVSRQWHLAIFH